MASEPTEEQQMTITLPPELAGWLDRRATDLEIPTETLLVKLLFSYREIDGDSDIEELAVEAIEGEQFVSALDEDTVADLIDERAVAESIDRELLSDIVESHIDEEVPERIESEVESAVSDRLSEATSTVQDQLEDRIDIVESDFQSKLDDVRERVIQVKKEADSKAPAEHDHGEFTRLADLASEVESLEETVDRLETELADGLPDHVETMNSDLEEVQERLQTVAWVVSDLRDAYESGSGVETVDRIKRAAATADIEHAKCENCGSDVTISLLTEPNCPHCEATVADVEQASGWFGSPTLTVASRLEPGVDDE